MNLSRLLILFSLFILLTSSLISTTSAALNCDNAPPPSEDSQRKQFLVFIKRPKGLLGGITNLINALLKTVLCLGRELEKFKSGQGLFGNGLINLNVITDLSADGVTEVFTGFFNGDDIDFLLQQDEIDLIEEVKQVTSIDTESPNIVKERKRTTQTGAPFVSIIEYAKKN
jgi:hypothetical protein